MSHRISEQLRQLAVKCVRLADNCHDKNTANELEAIGTEFAQKAHALDDPCNTIDKAT